MHTYLFQVLSERKYSHESPRLATLTHYTIRQWGWTEWRPGEAFGDSRIMEVHPSVGRGREGWFCTVFDYLSPPLVSLSASVHGPLGPLDGPLLPLHELDEEVAGHADAQHDDQHPQLGQDAHLQTDQL